MKSIFKDKPYPYPDPCAALDITHLYEPVFLYRSRRIDSSICLRPVCLPPDEEIVASCALLGWAKEFPFSPADLAYAEKKVLEAVARSDSGQHFLGMVDNRPVFLTGLYKALQHPVSRNFMTRDKDYFLTLQIPVDPGGAPGCAIKVSMEDLSLSILQACLAHYFSYPAVERVLIRVDKDNFQENELYATAGFRFLRDAEFPFRVYHHTGAGYLDR